jgi:hypothetical protein
MEVPGGTFDRSYDGVSSGYTAAAYPATVSGFQPTCTRSRFTGAPGHRGPVNGTSGLGVRGLPEEPGTSPGGWGLTAELNATTTTFLAASHRRSAETGVMRIGDATLRTW